MHFQLLIGHTFTPKLVVGQIPIQQRYAIILFLMLL